METPWGTADSVETIAEGIIAVTTPGHGGLRLDRKRQAKMPAYMRTSDRWYEEDCEWALVASVFPQHFTDAQRAAAKRTLKEYYPKAYARFYAKEAA